MEFTGIDEIVLVNPVKIRSARRTRVNGIAGSILKLVVANDVIITKIIKINAIRIVKEKV